MSLGYLSHSCFVYETQQTSAEISKITITFDVKISKGQKRNYKYIKRSQEKKMNEDNSKKNIKQYKIWVWLIWRTLTETKFYSNVPDLEN